MKSPKSKSIENISHNDLNSILVSFSGMNDETAFMISLTIGAGLVGVGCETLVSLVGLIDDKRLDKIDSKDESSM